MRERHSYGRNQFEGELNSYCVMTIPEKPCLIYRHQCFPVNQVRPSVKLSFQKIEDPTRRVWTSATSLFILFSSVCHSVLPVRTRDLGPSGLKLRVSTGSEEITERIGETRSQSNRYFTHVIVEKVFNEVTFEGGG